MGFIRINGLDAKIFIPEDPEMKAKKHNCRDCFACQMCSDERCEQCLKKARTGGRKAELRNSDSE